jgi:biopolymer transport protein ExbD
MAFWNQDHDDQEVLNEINVTPLVDVMLVLLVLFIVTASAITTAVHVDLPKADAGAPPEQTQPLVISVDHNGNYQLGDKSIGLNQLKSRLAAIHKQRPEQSVQLQADRSVPYGRVGKAMAVIQAVGIRKIAVLTRP